MNFKHTSVILAYKDSPYLEDCIKSLLSQSVKSEIIISTSTPSEFINRLSVKYNIPIFVNNTQRAENIASDWNFAFNLCKTQYLTLAHQDDIYLPVYTESLLSYIEKHPLDKSLILFTRYSELVDDKVRSSNINLFVKKVLLIPFYFWKTISCKFIKKLVLAFGNSIACPTVMFNKHNLGEFSFNESFSYNLDWDAWLNLAQRKGSFVFIPRKLLLHRLHKGSETSVRIDDNCRFEEEKLILQRVWGKYIAHIIASLYKLGAKTNKV